MSLTRCLAVFQSLVYISAVHLAARHHITCSYTCLKRHGSLPASQVVCCPKICPADRPLDVLHAYLSTRLSFVVIGSAAEIPMKSILPSCDPRLENKSSRPISRRLSTSLFLVYFLLSIFLPSVIAIFFCLVGSLASPYPALFVTRISCTPSCTVCTSTLVAGHPTHISTACTAQKSPSCTSALAKPPHLCPWVFSADGQAPSAKQPPHHLPTHR
ncbi:hypothetical protein IWZ01DRAFT_4341 [Phyllosticta capitalensis]